MPSAIRRLSLVLALTLVSLSAIAQVTTATLPAGSFTEAAAVNTVTNKIYAVNSQCFTYPCSTAATVTVIDGATNTTIGTVNIGISPGLALVNTATNKVYVANLCGNDPMCQSPGTVTVIDGATLQTATVPVGYAPGNSIHGIAINQTTNTVYVTNFCSGAGWPTCPPGNGTVTVINGSTLTTQTVDVGRKPRNVAVNPQTNMIYVANSGTPGGNFSTVTVIDGSTLGTQTVTTGYVTVDVQVDATTNKIYASNICGSDPSCQSGSVSVIDGATLNTQTVPTGYQPYFIAVNPVTNNIYVANGCSDPSCAAGGATTVINGTTLATTQVSVCSSAGQSPGDMQVNTVTNKIYTPCEDFTAGMPPGQTVYEIDGPTNTTFPIAVGDLPNASTVNSVTNTIYVPNLLDNTVSVIGGAAKLQLNAVTPCRLVDTRTNNGGGGPITGGTFQTFNLPQLAQTKCTNLNLSSAAAYSLNVTLVPSHGPVGYLSIWPASQIQPYVSTMNSDGRIKANAAIVPAGVSGQVSVFVTDTSDVILDIDGYFGPSGGSTLQFFPLSPCRIADTRDSHQPQGLGPPSLSAGVERDFPVLNATSCFPSGVTPKAYSLNFTAVPPGPLGYLTVWPFGESQPFVSTLNAPTGAATANAAIVPAGTNGEISTFAFNNTDLVIDINGYFAAPAQGGLSLYPTPPCRVLDTRPPSGNGSFTGVLSPPVDVLGSPCGVASQSLAYVLNATVVPHGSLGYLTLWPDGSTQPFVSTLNAYDRAISSNMAIVPAGNQGKIDAFAGQGTTDLILDISSFLAP